MRRLYIRAGIFLVVVLSGVLARLEAQAPAASPSVRVVAIDSASGEVLRRTFLWKFRRTPSGLAPLSAAMADSSGILHLDSVLAWPVDVACAGQQILDTHTLAELDEATVAAAAPSDTIRVWVDGAKCDRRPLLAEYSIWIGHFTEGFEESRLVLCSDSTRGVWVRYSDDWSRKPQPKWPEPNDKYYPRYFVGFRGRMVGPYHYGHMGVADFELTVDSVLFVRPPRQSDCAETVRQGS
jgi:hypothetical protein